MSTTNLNSSLTLIAGEDLRESVYSLLYINSLGLVQKTNAADVMAIGVLGGNPRSNVDTTGHGVSVVLLKGIIKVIAGEPIGAGSFVMIDPSNAGKVASVGTIAEIAIGISIGVALTDADIGDIFQVFAQPIS